MVKFIVFFVISCFFLQKNLIFSGNACGLDTNVQDYPYIYFVVPWPGYLARTVCLKSCPNFATWSSNLTLECYPNTRVTTCQQSSVNDILSYTSFPPSISNIDLNSSNIVFVYNTTGSNFNIFTFIILNS